MKAKVIKIGNSKGVRIPKAMIEQVGLEEDVVLEASGGKIVIRPASKPRANWSAAFKSMAERGDDALLDADNSESGWDKGEWKWK